ncbi:MAG: universal stress protein [Candidatus Methanofastidiosia archaeon]
MRILFCTEGSEHSEEAVRFGGRIAKAINAKVRILFVSNIPSRHHHSLVIQARRRLEDFKLYLPGIRALKDARGILQDYGVECGDDKNIKMTGSEVLVREKSGEYTLHTVASYGVETMLKIREGDPAEQILLEGGRKYYDMMVVGRKKISKAERILLGNVTQKVVEYSNIPVLVVSEDREIEKVFIGTDGSESAERAIKFSMVFLKALDSKVTLCSVAPSEDEDEFARRAIEKGGKILQENNLKYDSLILYGKSQKEILKVAKDYDLLILGSKGKSRIRKFLIGSTSLNVVWNSPTPVLIVR